MARWLAPHADPPGAGTAPGHLETVRMFVNTLDIEQSSDLLDGPAALQRWLREAGLADQEAGIAPGPAGRPAAAAVTEADLSRALAMREALRGVLRSHVLAGGETGQRGTRTGPADPAAALRELAAALPARLDVGADGRVAAVPAGTGVSAALARILLICSEAAATGTWSRLKACCGDDCQWAFYDRSPTRSGCWCSMQVCGSRAKSRAYRRRARPAGGAAKPRGS